MVTREPSLGLMLPRVGQTPQCRVKVKGSWDQGRSKAGAGLYSGDIGLTARHRRSPPVGGAVSTGRSHAAGSVCNRIGEPPQAGKGDSPRNGSAVSWPSTESPGTPLKIQFSSKFHFGLALLSSWLT